MSQPHVACDLQVGLAYSIFAFKYMQEYQSGLKVNGRFDVYVTAYLRYNDINNQLIAKTTIY